MASIFLSYAREDMAKAERIASLLDAAGHAVWWDRQLHAGSRFSAEIDTALRAADLIVVLWSEASIDSPWVQDEAQFGRDSNRLVPVLLQNVSPPLGFRQYHALDLSEWKGRKQDPQTKLLVKAVEVRLSGKESSPGPAKQHRGLLQARPAWFAIAALLLVAVLVAVFVVRAGKAEAEPVSLAVLPFKNMSPGDPYFAEGVAEEILNQLAREPQFKVAGRTSSALFKDAADLRDVGRRLHVDYVLEGSVRSAGSHVRVDVSLVDAKRGMRLWSQNFRGKLDDIFAIQDNIGLQVAARVKRRLVRQVAIKGTRTSGDVYSLYVTARSLIRQRQPGNVAAAAELLKRAVKLDPNYAPAWARLAQAVRFSRFYGHEDEPGAAQTRPDELRYVDHAIALAPDLAEGHAIRGMLLGSTINGDATQRSSQRAELERAVKLDPHEAEFWYWLHGARVADLDFEGALSAVRHTAEIDPYFAFSTYYPQLAWDMGDHEAAVRFLNNRIENHPEAYLRARAQSDLAYLQADWSRTYASEKQARGLGRPDMRSYAEEAMGFMLFRTGLVEEAKRFLPAEFIPAMQGVPPTAEKLRSSDALDFWLNGPAPRTARLLINSGRAAELVSLYDRAFGSPDRMLARLPKSEFVRLAPIAAAGLREAARSDEAMRLLNAADKLCADAMRRGRTPIGFQADCSRSWGMLGRRDAAIAMLQRAMARGWRPSGGWSWEIIDDPPYRDFRNDPRLKRLAAFVRAENARERRELLAAGV